MAGGKVHGGGGHGRHGREVQRVYAHQEKVAVSRERAIQKNKRKAERINREFLENIVPGFGSKVLDVLKIIEKKLSLKQITRNNALKMMIAVDEWYLEQIESTALKKRIILEPFSLEEKEKISIIGERKKREYLANLLGINPSISFQKEIINDLAKWKRRVPQILEGKY